MRLAGYTQRFSQKIYCTRKDTDEHRFLSVFIRVFRVQKTAYGIINPMAVLTINNVGQSFGAFDLFQGASASIPHDGKVGLVGPNGVGKTTLLLIVAGRTTPSSGSLHLARGTRLGYLPQDASLAFEGNDHTVYDEMLTVFAELRRAEKQLREMELAMSNGRSSPELLEQYSKQQAQFEQAGGYDYERRIKQVLTGLGFSDDKWAMPLPHLSGGQKTRVLLAKLLLDKPDLLILDEPTNHLDVEAIEWLEGTLKLWEGAILIVSHDRYFLDRVVNNIWEMSAVGIESYRGNYTAYVQQREDRWQQRLQAFADFKEYAAKEMDFIRRNIAGQRTQMAQGKLSRLAREVEAIRVGGLDALGKMQGQGWARAASELDLRRPAGTVGELQEQLDALPQPTRPHTLSMRLHPSHRSGNIVLRAQNLQVGYAGHPPLFVSDDIQLNRLQTAALIGPNGTGKSTFLRTILEQMPPLQGEIWLGASLKLAYFAQAHEALNLNNSVLDEFLHHHPMLISEARSYLARFLFRGDEVYNQVATLSGGERGRLALAILALEDANFLLLDEPTNHLDIPSQETLQEALEAFDGTILLVTHDRYLVDRLASQIWEVRNGRLRLYNGTYQDYLVQREAETAAAKAETAVSKPSEPDPGSNGTPLSKNAQRQRAEAIATVEAQIAAAEAQMEALSEALQDATQAQSFDRIQEISLEYAATEAKLEQLMASWETLLDE